MIPVMKVFQDLVVYESEQNIQYKNIGSTNESMTRLARRIVDNDQMVGNGTSYEFSRKDGSIETVKLGDERCCSCYYFLDKAMCKHLVAACLKENLPLLGLQ